MNIPTNYRASAWLLVSVMGIALAQNAAAQEAVSFQGRLVDDGAPVNGTHSLTFRFWQDMSSGSPLGSVTASDVPIQDGLFSANVHVDPNWAIAPGHFWSVAVDGTELSPRIESTAVPRALSATTLDGIVSVEYPEGPNGHPAVVAGSGHTLTPSSPGSTIAGGRSNSVDGLLSRIGGGTANSIVGHYGSIGGGRDNLVDDAYSGTIAGGVQNRVSGDRAFIGGGSLNTATGNRAVTVGGDDNHNAGAFGFLGGGTANQLAGEFASLLGGRNNRVAGDYSVVLGGRDTGVFADYGLAFGSQAIVNHRQSIVFSASDQRVESTAPSQFLIDAPGGVGVNQQSPQDTLDVNGTTRTKVLRITGGSDLAETFPSSGDCTIKPRPGMVLSIDPDNPGALRVTRDSYDRRVAGVYSGANGLGTGMVMGQEGCVLTGHGTGRLPVAMTGRVWVYVDESAGRVAPGDRLTTSGVKPGYAMKVTDNARSVGAVIGKAMTPVDPESGMALVLVNLQ
ncbi:hypothetical protein GF356_09315 [candidate division GN15 bacterium]|nr:hypothetical protein [candidate division GN15 bacterium]